MERAAGPASPAAWPLKLTALVHEEPPAHVSRVLARAGLGDQSPFVRAIVASFGELWKAGAARRAPGLIADRRRSAPTRKRQMADLELPYTRRSVGGIGRARRRAG